MSFKLILLAGLGGGLGSSVRFVLYSFFNNSGPWVTLIVNVSGGLLIGYLMRSFETNPPSNNFRVFWIAGFCGGFTTFSAFGLDFFNFIRQEQLAVGCLYAILSLIGTIFAVYLGFRVLS